MHVKGLEQSMLHKSAGQHTACCSSCTLHMCVMCGACVAGHQPGLQGLTCLTEKAMSRGVWYTSTQYTDREAPGGGMSKG